ncbi:MAG: RNA methyltransferase [Bacteroidota bacterium]
MLSNNQRKLILQLKNKKYRVSNNLFVAEGKKVVNELISNNWEYKMLFATDDNIIPEALIIKNEDMKKITHFNTPSPILGVFEIPGQKKIINESISIALEGINDPGNLGTIIRLCDWFGLSELFCSSDTVDCFNSKVIQASAGSIVRVNCHYLDDFPKQLISLNKPVYATNTNGESIYSKELVKSATYVFGSEAHGISSLISEIVSGEISIPKFRSGHKKAESLNVANATAIILSELLRPK